MRYNYTNFECAACCNMYATYTCAVCNEEVKLIDNIYRKSTKSLDGHNIDSTTRMQVIDLLSDKSKKKVEDEVNRINEQMKDFNGKCYFLNKPEYKNCPHCNARQHWIMGTLSFLIFISIVPALLTFLAVVLFVNSAVFFGIVLSAIALVLWIVSLTSTIEFFRDKKADQRNYTLKVAFSEITDCYVKN